MKANKFIPLWLACVIFLSSCGCDTDEHNRVWDHYRATARSQTAAAESGSIDKKTLQARYYILIMERDLNSKKCECPRESPSYMDRKQVFMDQVDPICVLALTKRYMELKQDTMPDSNGVRKAEIDGVVQMLMWYGNAVGIGGIQSYDAYGTLMPVDTSAINGRIRDLSHQFNMHHTPATKVELIECPEL